MKEKTKMSVLTSLFFPLFFVLTISLCLVAGDVFPIYPKNEQSEVSASVEQDTQRIGRRLQAAAKTTLFTVRGNVFPDGIYYVVAFIGNPPMEYNLDVDTGSDLTWLQCDAPCRSCAKTSHQLYKLNRRSVVPCNDPLCTAVQAANRRRFDCRSPNQQCDYEITYTDGGSSLGFLIRDSFTVKLTNNTVVRPTSVFGCGYDQTGSLKQQQTTDGILGLSGSTASLPSQWERQGLIKNVIGICINGGGKKGGYLFFGDNHVPTSMTWVPVVGRPSIKYYHVGAAQMIYGSKFLAKEGDERRLGGIIFDSGSSYTYFTKQAYEALVPAVKESIGRQLSLDVSDKTLPLCWKGKRTFRSVADVKSYFKPLTFNFKSTSPYPKNAKFVIPPEGYLIISKKGNVCLGILDGTTGAQYNVIGDISLQGYLVIHDNSNNRIGWINTDCTKNPKSSQRRWALEDPQQLAGEEEITFTQDAGKGVCPSTSYSLPYFGTLY